MEKRILGRTGREISILGLGGVVLVDTTQEQANAIVGYIKADMVLSFFKGNINFVCPGMFDDVCNLFL